MRKDVAFACQQFQLSERLACKLLGRIAAVIVTSPGRTRMGRREKRWPRWHDRNRGTDIGDCLGRCLEWRTAPRPLNNRWE
jgi:hypothetical protein